MSGLDRFIRILRLFGEAKSEWTVQEMADTLVAPASTVYRTVRDLVAADLLEPASEAQYRLGAAFIEFERLIRLTDPLVQAGNPLLRDLSLQVGQPCAVFLARLYGDTVMCVADDRPSNAGVETSYERGRPMPLTRGATSKAILAQLPARRLGKILLQAQRADAKDPFAVPVDEFRAQLIAVRKRGYCITRGEVDKGLVGIAVPIAVSDRGINASLTLVVEAASLDDRTERRLVMLMISTAALLTDMLVERGNAGHAARNAG
jgi:DNA-binding IclR family transcriptional regulator